MKLFTLGPGNDYIARADNQWYRTVYALRSCTTCGYLLNNQRNSSLDVVLAPDSDMRLAPVISTWGIVDIYRQDLIDDLQLTSDDCVLGDVYIGRERLPHYKSVVLPPERWVFEFSLPLIAGSMRPCMSCGRLGLQSDMSDGTYVVYESMTAGQLGLEPDMSDGYVVYESMTAAGSDIYDCLGVTHVITDRALSRIRPSIIKELSINEVTVVHFNHCKGRFV